MRPPNRALLLARLKGQAGQPALLSPREAEQLAAGVPLQKIVGSINYDALPIAVDRAVFIPRLETVEVVNFAAALIKPGMRVLDLCTGSGYIGLTIKQKTQADVTLVDIDPEAIAQATSNAKRNGLTVTIIRSDLFANVTGQFDVIVANPPYLPTGLALDEEITRYEPATALWGGPSGNDFYARIIAAAPRFLRPGGHLVFEMSAYNFRYLKAQGFAIWPDISGKPRIAHRQFGESRAA